MNDDIYFSRGLGDARSVCSLGPLELPQSNTDSDDAFTPGLQLVEHPCVIERILVRFSFFLLELFNGSLINTATLLDHVTGGGRLFGVDVADDHDFDVKLSFTHDCGVVECAMCLLKALKVSVARSTAERSQVLRLPLVVRVLVEPSNESDFVLA
jgi:hypothetical protein